MKRKHKRLTFVIIALGLLGVAAGLVLSAFEENIVFFYSPTDIAKNNVAEGQRIRLGGLVEEGSVKKAGGAVVNFRVTDLTTVIAVTYKGLLPDLFSEGQGIVAETLNLSELRGYRTGGTIHVVVNNQVGFTTVPQDARTSVYATDVAKTIQAPIFHVNGDDPEAVVRVSQLAFAYREKFHKDVVIDLVCYRRRGHNEGDDPSYTQPLMYDLIEQKRSVRKLYTESLIGRGDITIEEAEQVLKDYQQQLERVFVETKEAKKQGAAASAPDSSTGTDAAPVGSPSSPQSKDIHAT